jgi:hypothetical protein
LVNGAREALAKAGRQRNLAVSTAISADALAVNNAGGRPRPYCGALCVVGGYLPRQ